MATMETNNEQTISEGLATVKTQGHVFYNPVQEFNRDLRYRNRKYLIRAILTLLIVFQFYPFSLKNINPIQNS